MTFETRQVGRTDVSVSAVSFGCASIGNLYQAISDEDAQAVLTAAWDAGIRYFDTAPHYGRGLSEKRLGDFLKTPGHESAVISTKVGRLLSPGTEMAEADGFINPLPNNVRYDYSGPGILQSFEHSCKLLGRDYIDIVFVHDLGTYTHGAGDAPHRADFFDSGYDMLCQLKAEGRIGAIGIGVNEVQICLDVMDHGPIDVILLAGRLSLLDRSGEEVLVPRCRAEGTSLVLGGIFNSGILATGAVDGATYDYLPATDAIKAEVNALQTKAEGLGMSLAQAALHYAITHPAAASTLIGTAKTRSLLRNLDLASAPIPAGFRATFG